MSKSEWLRSLHTSCFHGYHLMIVIIEHRIKISVDDSGGNKHIGVSLNNLYKPKRVHKLFKKMRVNHVWPISPPFGVEGYAIQRTHLTVIIIQCVAYIIYF